MLRPGHVHNAECWQQPLEQVVARYRDSGRWKYLRADAAFTSPEIYEYLEQEGIRCTIRLPAKQWVKEGRYALYWTRLSCHRFVANQVRLALFVLAYNLGNFLRRLVLPENARHWSLRSIQVKLIKIGAKGSSPRTTGNLPEGSAGEEFLAHTENIGSSNKPYRQLRLKLWRLWPEQIGDQSRNLQNHIALIVGVVKAEQDFIARVG